MRKQVEQPLKALYNIKILKGKRGITLIALIISIIILVILVAVSISAINRFGIIDYAINGVNKYKEAAEDEKNELKKIEEMIKNNIEENNKSDINININVTGTKLKDNEAALTGLPAITTGVQAVVKSVYTDSAGDKAIIPVGFAVSDKSGENKVSSGLVIKDTNENEFVWIPVDQNQVINLSVTSKEDIESIILYNPYGDKIIDLTNQGKSYSTTINTYGNADCANGGYTAIVTTANDENEKTLSVRSLYAMDAFNDYLTSNDYARTRGYTNLEEMIEDFISEGGIYHYEGYEDEANFIALKISEGNTLSEIFSNKGCNNIYEYFNYEDYEDYQEKIVEEFSHTGNSLIKDFTDLTETDESGTRVLYSKSINENGGFYIGRYEAGAPTPMTSVNVNTPVSSIITTNGIPVCKANQTVYNWTTRDQAKGLAESMYNNQNFTCTLLTGAAWDRTLGFISESGTNSKTISQIACDSTTWGNYLGAQFPVTNTNAKYSEYSTSPYTQISSSYIKAENSRILLTTGAIERNTSKNIYDIAGNIFEYTSESKSSNVIIRGGYFYNYGILSANKRIINLQTDRRGGVGFRSAIFITD